MVEWVLFLFLYYYEVIFQEIGCLLTQFNLNVATQSSLSLHAE